MTKTIQTVALEELWKSDMNAHIPVLIEIFNPDIRWDDGSLEQENMYLRVIDDSNPVIYQGKKYLPCKFTFTPPEESGKNIGQASITISAIDSRIVQLLRSVELECEVTAVAAFAKKVVVTVSGEQITTYMFKPLDQLKTSMQSATYNKTTATFNLVFKDVLKLNVPRNVATKDKLPSMSING